LNNIGDNEQLLSQLRRTHNAVTTYERKNNGSICKFNSINRYAYERLSQSTIAPDIWNRESNPMQSREVYDQTTLDINEHSECLHMNFIHQMNCP
jgi:hypothetical protein